MARARSAPAASPPPLQWPLVGRQDELDLFVAGLGDPRAHGFVIHGAPGVGKTRLADQCLALADQHGRNVARATATEGSQSAPLGALAHLLPPGIGDERRDLVAVVAELRPVLEDQTPAGPLVLFVDDLHLLDATSATLVSQLVDADLVFLVATVRSEAPLPAGVEALWHRARVRRVDLEDLDRDAVGTLLHLVLRGPVEAGSVAEIWTASQGNVLLVRELVLGALDRGNLVEQRGVWRLVGPLVDDAPAAGADRRPPRPPAAGDGRGARQAGGVGAGRARHPRGHRRRRPAGAARPPRPAHGADRRAPAGGAARPPALRRDPPGAHGRPDPPPPPAGARRPDRRLGRPPP